MDFWDTAISCLKAEDYEGAIKAYDEGLQKVSNDKKYVLMANKGLAFMNLKKYNEAISCFQDALEHSKEHYESLHNMGVAYTALGQYDKALQQFKDALNLDPEFYPSLCGASDIYTRYGRFKEAYATARKAISLQKDDPIGHTAYACALFKDKKTDEAIQSFERARELGDDSSETERLLSLALRRYAQQLEHEGKHQLALEMYERSTMLKSQASAFHNCGVLKLRLTSDTEKGREYFKKALEVDPTFSTSLIALGALSCSDKNYEEAVDYFKKACEVDHKNTSARYNLALALMNLDRRDEAISYMKSCSELEPSNLEVLYALDVLQNTTTRIKPGPSFTSMANGFSAEYSQIETEESPLISDTTSVIHSFDRSNEQQDAPIKQNANPIQFYSLYQLQIMDRSAPYEGVLTDKLEESLPDDEFFATFGLTREEFRILPTWRQQEMKKELGIF